VTALDEVLQVAARELRRHRDERLVQPHEVGLGLDDGTACLDVVLEIVGRVRSARLGIHPQPIIAVVFCHGGSRRGRRMR